MIAHFDIYGVVVRIESRCDSVVESIAHDFRFFETTTSQAPDIELTFHRGTPPWEDIPLGTLALFRTTNNTTYRVGPKRYVDHHGRALTVYDFAEDHGDVYSENAQYLHEVAYLLVLSRVGEHLDRKGLRRVHALALSIEQRAVLLLAGSGCGKTSLGLEMMKCPDVKWLSDEIPIIDRAGHVRPFPLPPRLTQGAAFPWPPPPVRVIPISRTKHPPKAILDIDRILPRVDDARPLAAVLHCRRLGGSVPGIRRLGFFGHFAALFRNAVTGSDFPQTKAYFLRLSPAGVARRLRIVIGRTLSMLRTAWRVPGYRFEMGDDLERNAEILRDHLRGQVGVDPGAPANEPNPPASQETPRCSSAPNATPIS